MKGIIFGLESKDLIIRRQPGAHRIASFLREHGWDIEVFDFGLFFTKEQLIALAKSRFDSNMKWIGISTLFSESDLGHFEEFFAWVKINYPDIKIIFGSQVKLRAKHKAHSL